MDLKITGCVDGHGRVTRDPTGGLFTARWPNGTAFGYYKTMQHANIGRMYLAALANVPKTNKRSKSGWPDLARATGIITPTHTKDGKRRTGLSAGVSNTIFHKARHGTLPKDPEQLDKLRRLAGEPWLSQFAHYTPKHSEGGSE